MGIPNKINPMTGGDILPRGYIAAEFLKSTTAQRIEIPNIEVDYQDVLTFKKSQHIQTATAGIYSTLKNGGRCRLFYGGGTIYVQFFSNEVNIKNYYLAAEIIEVNKDGVKFDSEFLPFSSQVTRGSDTGFCLFTEKIGGTYYNIEMAIHWFNISNKLKLRPVLDSEGVPCMFDTVTRKSFYNSGTGQFIVGMTVSQARYLRKLPIVASGTLTVSLPWEAQLVITGVPAALQIAADRGWTITVQYREPEVDNAYYNKYATCTKVADMQAINADYQNDLTADGEWIYPLPELEDGEYLFYEVKNLHIFNMTLPKLKKANQMFGYSGLVKISIVAPLLEDATTLIYSLNSLEEVYFELPVCTNFNYFMPGAGKARRVIGSFALCKTAAAAFNINRSLEEIDARFPALENGVRLFDGCQLKKQFALDCLNSIPSYTSGTHNIMLGIHIDYQNDEEVLTAITNAEAKGWTVTVQWNGTATAAAASVSTFGLRSPSIYAKLGTVELPDGTIEQILSWGHYVTNWEENGYQEFSSVEEAEEYFNINQTEEEV